MRCGNRIRLACARRWAENQDLTGYGVEAIDGSIGNIDEATQDADAAHLVVDTGFWIFGKKRLIPAGAVTAVDHDQNKVSVNMTKDQIKAAPDYDSGTWSADERSRYDEYYGQYAW